MANLNAATMDRLAGQWEHKGYFGSGNVAGLLATLPGRTAIVCGSARGVFEEVQQITDWFDSSCKWFVDADRPVVFAANDVGVLLPQVDHFVSLHTPKLDHWAALRRDSTSAGYGNKDFSVHDAGLFGVRPWNQWHLLTPTMALSGLFAMQIAYLMGCRPIILCGCPCDSTPRFWESECNNAAYRETQSQVTGEMGFKPEFKQAVRSMSGWTKEFFGCP